MRKRMVTGIILTLLSISMLTSPLNAQLSGAGRAIRSETGGIGTLSLSATSWNKTYGGSGNDVARSVVQTTDGGYAMAGLTNSSGAGGYDFWLVKTDLSGSVQWNKTYGGSGDDEANSVVQTTDGGYAVAGYTNSYGAGSNDFWLVKTDANGNMQWNKTYGGTNNDAASALVRTTDGGYALAGETQSFGGGGRPTFWLVKTDASGNGQWNKTYSLSSADYASALVQTSDGGYALAGTGGSLPPPYPNYCELVKTNASGNMQWSKSYGGTSGDSASALVRTSDGGYALAGYTNSFGAGGYDFWLVKTDANGNMQWNKTYGGTGADDAYSVIQTSDGGYALAGYTNSFGAGGYDFWLVKLTPTTICINSDGSIYPSTAAILQNANVYTFTDNISTTADVGIIIERNNMTLDGAGYMLDGGGVGSIGISASTTTNVTVRNLNIHAFGHGIYLSGSSNNMIIESNVTDCPTGILVMSSSGNTLAGNQVANSEFDGILLCPPESGEGSSNNTITGNTLTNNTWGVHLASSSNNFLSENIIRTSSNTGIWIEDSSDNVIAGNNMTMNYQGIETSSCSNDSIYHNNFVNNSYKQASASESTDVWDEGYPSGGNYWSDYNGTDLRGGPYQNETGSDGIGDTPYVIDVNNRDNYPLMQPYSAHSTRYSWPMFHHDDSHSGYSESPAPGTNNKLWNYTTGNWVYSSPVVVDGRVYVGSYDNRTYCLDASNGAQVWNYTTGSYVFSSPAVADGRVYVGSFDGRVYCLDASNGVQVWNYTTGNQVLSSPAVADGRVYVGSFDGRVYCLDASNGAQVWNYTTGGVVYSSPAVVGGSVYVGSWDNRTYCLDASNGAQVWNYTTGNKVYSSPVVVDGRVYVGSYDNRVYCLDASNGAQVWNYTANNWVYSSPAVADGRVYVGSWDNRTYCLDASNGAQVWNYTAGSYVFSSPAVAGGRVYVGSSDGRVYCLDASNGVQVWNYTTGNGVFSSPAVADGVLYVGSEDGSVYAFGTVLRVPEDYKTIQAAINAAAPGATIWVDPGVYSESLVINKTITLIGKPGSEPIFNGGGSGIAVKIVPSGSGSTIAGITITNWDQGVLVDGASGCKIYDDIMTLTNNAIAFQGTSAASNQVYSNIFQQDAVGVDVTSSSQGNTISQNIFKLSTVGLKVETGGNIIYANMISNNQLGMSLVNSDNNVIYHNDFVDNTYAVQMSFTTSTGNKWDDGYPQGGNYWASYTGVDKKAGPNQDIPGSDGIGDTPYMIAVNNTDNYPLMKPFNEHDIGIAVFIVNKTVIFRGFTCNMTVSILNYGLYNETFNLAIWANQTRINLQPIVLTNRSSMQTTFVWITTGLPYGKYNLTSVVDTVPGETDTADNNFTGGWVFVSTVGDLTGGTSNPWDFVPDGKVDGKDIAIVALCFGSAPGCPPPYTWNANCDVNNDAKIDGADIATVALHFGQAGP